VTAVRQKVDLQSSSHETCCNCERRLWRRIFSSMSDDALLVSASKTQFKPSTTQKSYVFTRSRCRHVAGGSYTWATVIVSCLDCFPDRLLTITHHQLEINLEVLFTTLSMLVTLN